MRLSATYRLFLIILTAVLILPQAQSYAQTQMAGEFGVDLRTFGFSNLIKSRDAKFNVDRSLSSHFLNLNLGGPIVNSHFANFVTNARVYGTYYDASSEGVNRNLYIEPDLNGYFGQITMFPDRSYPVQLYQSKSIDYTLRYETNNRTSVDFIQPGLAVLRRYDSERTSRGGLSRISLSDKVSLLSEYKEDQTEILRDYDYNEDKDIWVNVATGLTDPLAETHTLVITNEIPDAAVRVFVGNLINVLLAPGEDVIVDVDSGFQDVSVIPLTYYNQYRFRIDVRSDLTFKITYKAPPTPVDQDQTATSATFGLSIDGGEKYQNEALYEYADQKEGFQNLTIFMGNFSNNATWNLSNTSTLSFLTTANRNRTIVDTSSSQLDKAFMHLSTYDYNPRQGVSGSFSYAYSNNYSNTGVDELTSDMNSFINTVAIPSERLSHRLDVKNNISLLADNTGYVNNLYSTMITNRIVLDMLGATLEPRNEFKYSWNRQGLPAKNNREIETKFILDGTISRTRILGDITFSTYYKYRNKFDVIGSNTLSKYFFDLTLNRKFGDNYHLFVMTAQELEVYGGSTPTPGSNRSQNSAAKSDLRKTTYRVDFQLTPTPDASLATNLMFITQETSRITKLGLSVNAVIPIIGIPVKSFVLKEIRELADLPKQTQFSIVTKVNYQFRQISFIMSHTYATEDQIANDFAYYQIDAKITRRFSVF